jgi:Flp pilus assembly protein TadG
MIRPIDTRRHTLRSGWDEGAVAVEAAITLFALLLLIFGIIEYGTAFWQWNTMALAVEQAGRYVMVYHDYPNNPPGCVGTLAFCAETKVMQPVLGASRAPVCASVNGVPTAPAPGNLCVYAAPPLGANPQTMTLTALYNFNLIALAGPFTMTSQATFPLD